MPSKLLRLQPLRKIQNRARQDQLIDHFDKRWRAKGSERRKTLADAIQHLINTWHLCLLFHCIFKSGVGGWGQNRPWGKTIECRLHEGNNTAELGRHYQRLVRVTRCCCAPYQNRTGAEAWNGRRARAYIFCQCTHCIQPQFPPNCSPYFAKRPTGVCNVRIGRLYARPAQDWPSVQSLPKFDGLPSPSLCCKIMGGPSRPFHGLKPEVSKASTLETHGIVTNSPNHYQPTPSPTKPSTLEATKHGLSFNALSNALWVFNRIRLKAFAFTSSDQNASNIFLRWMGSHPYPTKSGPGHINIHFYQVFCGVYVSNDGLRLRSNIQSETLAECGWISSRRLLLPESPSFTTKSYGSQEIA